MDTLGDYPGLPGFFVAGITCASLRLVSYGNCCMMLYCNLFVCAARIPYVHTYRLPIRMYSFKGRSHAQLQGKYKIVIMNCF